MIKIVLSDTDIYQALAAVCSTIVCPQGLESHSRYRTVTMTLENRSLTWQLVNDSEGSPNVYVRSVSSRQST